MLLGFQSGRTLVTGFGPFAGIPDNPSEHLARTSGRSCVTLEVSFEAVEAFLESLRADPVERLIMVGVAASAKRMRVETVARNWIDPRPDVRGLIRGPAPIDPTGPEGLASRLAACPGGPHWEVSADAGAYLCNFLLYRSLQRLSCPAGFVHIPPFEVLPEPLQRAEFQRLLALWEAETVPAAAQPAESLLEKKS